MTKNIKFVLVSVVAALVGGWLLFTVAPSAHAANLYAQYGDGYAIGGGTGVIDSAYMAAVGTVQYVQVELNITNDEQRGTSYYCPIAPNTGVLVFIFQGQNYVYVHCVTSAEAAGKLGRAATYTFDDAHFSYGGGNDWWANFTSQGTLTANIYGASVANGSFYPYLVLADSGGLGSPAIVGSLGQYSAGTYAAGVTTTIPENGEADGNAVTLTGVPQSFFASDTVAFQVEIEPFGVAFTGIPTATSTEGASGATTSVTIAHLAPGAYHWTARSVDITEGYRSAWTEYRVAGNIDFRIPTTSVREPIVIVPGVLGSRLVRASDGSEIWPDAEDMINSASDNYLDFLKMGADGLPVANRAVIASDILREATTTFLGITFDGVFYRDLIDRLAALGYVEGRDLFVAPYDWRLSVESSTDALAVKIEKAVAASPTGKVNLIAHSMGGLIVKQYLADGTHSSFVDKVVFAGVPQLGAPKAWKLLNYGDDLGLNWFGIGLNQDEMRNVATNMPAVYELLPSRRYVGVAGSYVRDFRNGGSDLLDYDATPSPNASLVHAADIFHLALDAEPLNASSVYNIVGCGRPTITGFNLYDGGVVGIALGAGDGTVPETSAMNLMDGATNLFVLGGKTGIDHGGLVRDARLLDLISGIIDGTIKDSAASSSFVLPAGISASLSDCFADGDGTAVEFSTHSPVALNVYDSEGRHTGVTDAGNIETGIPGSGYEQIGENSFAILPAPSLGESYRVLDTALATGTFEMKVKQYNGTTVTHAATYLSIPLEGASTTAELDYSGFEGDMELALDNDGDGSTETTMMPSAELSSLSAAADIAPPELVMPIIPARVERGSTATLVFSATDVGSGVAMMSAMLDGVPVTSEEKTTFTTLGSHTFTLIAVDRAGNPRTGEVDFEVLPPTIETAVFPASRDTYISSHARNKNYGFTSVLDIGGNEDARALLNFG